MQAITPVLMLFSVLVPTKMWYSPGQPLMFTVKAEKDATVVLTDFEHGSSIAPKGNAAVGHEKPFDARQIFPDLNTPGVYVLYAKAAGGDDKTNEPGHFLGTPVVISVRADSRRGAPEGPMVVRVEPLRYAVMSTDFGDVTMAFYYDVAPNTVDNFLRLASGGYFDGLTFHRIVPGFVIQGGDPRGDGTGGPGYSIDAEFNDRQHREGVLSMARSQDPNSGGSQFFVCLNYENTAQLDRKYTAFGKVMSGMDAVKKIAAVPIADQQAGRPEKPPVIKQVTVLPVTVDHNPYAQLQKEQAAAQPKQ